MIEVGPVREDERTALADVLAHSFDFTRADAAGWIELAGPENGRVVRRDGIVAGGLLALPMGQFFGGRRVAMTGISAVGVSPEHRGGGTATALMEAVVRELHEQEIALSALYPATVPLYRRAGWEVAGGRWECRAQPRLIAAKDRDLPLRLGVPDDEPAIRELQREIAATIPGSLDRHRFLWHRAFDWRGTAAMTYVVGEPMDGYVMTVREPSSKHYGLFLTDVQFRTAAAGRRILSFLADHGSLADHVRWRTGPDDRLVQLFTERNYTCKLVDHFMLRVAHVQSALSQRGWPAGFAGAVEIEVDDPLIPENAGRWTIDVADGAATVRRGGSGALRLHVRGLAALYSGFRTPRALQIVGLADGDPRAMDLAASAFAGPAPVMADPF